MLGKNTLSRPSWSFPLALRIISVIRQDDKDLRWEDKDSRDVNVTNYVIS